MAHPLHHHPAGSTHRAFPLHLLTILLTLTTPTHALSVAKKAAVGISVGFGTLLLISLGAIMYLKFSPARRAERRAKREAGGEISNAEAIEFHARDGQRNFNIWEYDHDAVMAKKKAVREQQGRGHGAVEETGL